VSFSFDALRLIKSRALRSVVCFLFPLPFCFFSLVLSLASLFYLSFFFPAPTHHPMISNGHSAEPMYPLSKGPSKFSFTDVGTHYAFFSSRSSIWPSFPSVVYTYTHIRIIFNSTAVVFVQNHYFIYFHTSKIPLRTFTTVFFIFIMSFTNHSF